MSDANDAARLDREAYIRGLEKADELATLRADNERLRAALEKADNALTQFVAFEDDCRAIMGNTNFRILTACQTEVRAALAEEKPTFTEGHCEHKKAPGGCQLHNLHCGYPDCDRRPA